MMVFGRTARLQRFRRWYDVGNPVMRVVDVGVGVTLSPHLVGMHFHRWPEGNPLSPAPTYGFGTVRSHDYGGLANPGMGWNKINTAAGTYDWTTMDTWVNAHFAAGRKLVYTLYGTPAYLRTSDTLDDYGNIGGASVPSDSASGYPALQSFITALVNRYNDGTVEGRKIDVIEAWNEPKFEGVEDGFWWGTAGQIVDIARAVSLSIAASVDPGVRVWSVATTPIFDVGSRLNAFLAAESPVQLGTYGRDWIDEISVHAYAHGYTEEWGGARIETRIAEINATIARYPSIAGMSWHMSEQGSHWVMANVNPHGWTPSQWGTYNARYVTYQGLLGAQSVCLYSHDGTLSGDYTKPEFAEPLNRVHTELAGKTITRAYIRKDGALDLIADGKVVRL